MMPIVFWASLLPWLNAMNAADPIWRRRKTAVEALRVGRRNTLKMSAMNSRPTVNPTIGEPTSGTRTFVTMPSMFHDEMPAEMSDAPSRPPIRAWLDDDGIPSRQVSRFQMMAPTRAAAIMV